MAYRFAYPNVGTNGYGVDPTAMSAGYPNMYNGHQRSYSPESFSSDSESSDDYEYRGRMVTRETRHPRDIVRAPTPPPIIKRVVERAPTPEAPVMERVIIRPQAQEIVERVIEQPCTPPPRIIQKELHEEAPPPIIRTRVIKVDRPIRSGFSQPGSPYNNPCQGLASFNGVLNCGNGYRAQSIVGSARPAVYPNALDSNPSFSSASTFEYVQPMQSAMQQPTMMMMMPQSQQTQPMGVMQQLGQPVQQQMMHRPMQMQSLPFFNRNYMYQIPRPGMSFGYRPMMQQGRMIPSGMSMMATGNTFGTPMSSFPNQSFFYNPMAQQLVY